MASMRTPLEHALEYAAEGWPVFPVWPPLAHRCSCPLGDNCKSPGKHPIPMRGLLDASTDPEVIRRFWEMHPGANVGIVCGFPGPSVLDVDDPEKAPFWLQSLLEEEPRTARARTGGGRFHLFFSSPEGFKVKPKVKAWPGVDVRGDGSYVVAAPSRHIDGSTYRWDCEPDDLTELPDEVLLTSAVTKEEDFVDSPEVDDTSDVWLPDFEVANVLHALTQTDGESREEWLRVAMALRSTRDPRAYGWLDDWSKERAGGNYDAANNAKQWRSLKPDRGSRSSISIATLFEGVEQLVLSAGARPDPDGEDYVAQSSGPPPGLADLHEAYATEEVAEVEETESTPLPPEALNIEGPMKDFFDWVLATSPRPRPILALCSSIAFFAMMASRKYTYRGNRTNLYALAIAPSGGGKSAPQGAIRNMVAAVDPEGDLRLRACLGRRFASGQAIPEALVRGGGYRLTMDDEGGEQLRALCEDGAKMNVALAELRDAMLELFSSPPSYESSDRANQRINKRVTVADPAWSYYGNATPTLFGDLSLRALHTGFLPRFLLFLDRSEVPSDPRFFKGPNLSSAPPDDLVQLIRSLWIAASGYGGFGEPSGEFPLDKIEAQASPEVEDLFLETANEADNLRIKSPSAGIFWTRLPEFTIKLSLLSAVANHGWGSPRITVETVEWARCVAMWCIQNMVDEFEDRTPPSPRTEMLAAVLRRLRESDVPLTIREIYKPIWRKLTSKDAKAIIADLEVAGVVIAHPSGNMARPAYSLK